MSPLFRMHFRVWTAKPTKHKELNSDEGLQISHSKISKRVSCGKTWINYLFCFWWPYLLLLMLLLNCLSVNTETVQSRSQTSAVWRTGREILWTQRALVWKEERWGEEKRWQELWWWREVSLRERRGKERGDAAFNSDRSADVCVLYVWEHVSDVLHLLLTCVLVTSEELTHARAHTHTHTHAHTHFHFK